MILPGQVHHWEGGLGPEGSLVLFTDDFLVDHPGDRAVLRELGSRWFALDAEHDRSVRCLIGELVAEHRQRATSSATPPATVSGCATGPRACWRSPTPSSGTPGCRRRAR
ncbi:hypothetical protein [Streptomyces misionensis]|uniref:hypothetical protein n=1 Tax=Streptomyces misionensis TaxID=67331 RepID=UPI003F4B8BC6